jgi:hypothetical protein
MYLESPVARATRVPFFMTSTSTTRPRSTERSQSFETGMTLPSDNGRAVLISSRFSRVGLRSTCYQLPEMMISSTPGPR